MALPQLPLLVCDSTDDHAVRARCRGAWMGFGAGPHFYAWQRDMSVEGIRARRLGTVLAFIIDGILALIALIIAGSYLYIRYLTSSPEHIPTRNTVIAVVGLLIWLLIARFMRRNNEQTIVHRTLATTSLETGLSWHVVSKFHGGSYHNMASSWEPRALKVFEDAVLHAFKTNTICSSWHIVYRLLDEPAGIELFARFELPLKQLKEIIHQRTLKQAGQGTDSALWHIVAHAYLAAAGEHFPRVTVSHVLASVIAYDTEIQQLLEQLGILPPMLAHGLAWMGFQRKLSGDYREFWRTSAHHTVSDAGAAMTGLATPMLNSMSRDLLRDALQGYVLPVVHRDGELQSIARIFESGSHALLLTGETGVGKMALIEALALAIATGTAPRILADKRLLVVPISAIISGSNSAQYYDRLMTILEEAAHSGNVALVFEGIEGICGIKAGGAAGQDLSDTLAEIVDRTGLVIMATCTESAYRTTLANTKLGTLFTRLAVTQLSPSACVEVLEARCSVFESRQSVYFTYQALESAVTLAQKFLHDDAMPQNALRLIAEVAASVHAQKGRSGMVSADDVGIVVSQKANVPTTSVGTEERDKLLGLEQLLHERVIGQSEAVTAVSSALRRARTSMRAGNRPIASFLFLGPTGVGKTETTKALAAAYFGGEDRLIRFDMSEFQDATSIARLLGSPNEQGTGLLTAAIKEKPFALLLLDEFEKADKGVLNLFLQVMDDGRITDSTGRVIDCTNLMIIATSNAGSAYIQEAVRSNIPQAQMKEALLQKELQGTFRPELLNRFDGVIVFTPLTLEYIEEIAHLMVHSIATRLYEKEGIHLEVSDSAITEMADQGYSPEFGARPLRRVITEHLETVVADLLLAQKVTRNQTIFIDAGQTVTVR